MIFSDPPPMCRCPRKQDGMDFEGEVGIIVDRVPMGTRAAQAGAHIKLLVLHQRLEPAGAGGQGHQDRLRFHAVQARDQLRPGGGDAR